MAKSAKFDVVVLFTHELRIAAKAVLAAVAMLDDNFVCESFDAPVSDCYSTREAAEAAREAGK